MCARSRWIIPCVLVLVLLLQSKEQQLKDHQENKHPKSTFEVRRPTCMQAVLIWTGCLSLAERQLLHTQADTHPCGCLFAVLPSFPLQQACFPDFNKA